MPWTENWPALNRLRSGWLLASFRRHVLDEVAIRRMAWMSHS